MSLFKARDWWSVNCGSDEEFDIGCLCVANIDNSPDGLDKIIVGSFSGVLRIYNPHPYKEEDGSITGFRADELLLESQLNFPILQVKTGRLVSSSNLNHLAILHPRKLSVYTVSVSRGTVDHGTHYLLSLTYEHNLRRSAHCLVIGPFGGVKGKDFICVQSLDGTLTFFEQESFAFSRFIPGFLIPSPFGYVAKTDSFITSSSGWCLESYRFQVLAVAKDSDTKEESENIVKGKKVLFDWSLSIGEAIIDLTVVEYNNAPPTIMVLGERNLFALKPNGMVRYMKKLDYNPSCFLPFESKFEDSIMILVVTHSQTLLVYKDTTLCWASQLPHSSVHIQRATLKDLMGAVVILSDQGALTCCYLGTDPSLFVAPVTETREIDFAKAEEEMHNLKKIIKASNNSFPGSNRLENELKIHITVPQHLDAASPNESTMFCDDGEPVPCITVKIQLKSSSAIQDVRLMIHLEHPLVVSPNVFNFPTLSDYSQVVVSVQLENPFLPTSLNFRALAVYSNSNGAPRVAESTALLPLRLLVKSCPPSKSAEFKITIETNKNAVSMNDLFPELVDVINTSNSAAGFEYYGGQTVTVLASKTSQRYRIQSDSFPALWLLTSELVRRLQRYFKKDGGSGEDLKCLYNSAIPLQEYFSVIEEHFECRQSKQQIIELLSQRASQFRAVQKRLLTKLKDKTPTPLNNLDTLLEATHRQILSLAESLEDNIQALKNSSCSLSCATRLINLLLKLNTGMKENEFANLRAVLSPHADVEYGEGWEERTDIAATYLLKTCLAKVGKEVAMTSVPLEMPKDLSRLRKHLTVMIDRLVKGGHILLGTCCNPDEIVTEEDKNETFDEEDEADLPIGSRLGGRRSAGNEKKIETGLISELGQNHSLTPLKEAPSRTSMNTSASNIEELEADTEENALSDTSDFF